MGYKYFSWLFMKLVALFDMIWQDQIQSKTAMSHRETGADCPIHFLLIMLFSFLPGSKFWSGCPLYCTSMQQFICGVVSGFANHYISMSHVSDFVNC